MPPRGHPSVVKLRGICLNPLSECIKPLARDDARSTPPPLQRRRKHGDANACEREICHSTQQGPAQAVRLGAAELLRFPAGKLSVRDGAQGFCVLALV
eukprot:15457595-Alexandrium_andersonii.AAC.1